MSFFQLQQQHFFFIEWVFFHFIFMVSHLCFISLYLLSLNALDFFSSFLMSPSSFKILGKILFSFSVIMYFSFSSFILPRTTRNVGLLQYCSLHKLIQSIKNYCTRNKDHYPSHQANIMSANCQETNHSSNYIHYY